MSMVAQPTTTSKISLEVARMAAAGLKVAQPSNPSLWRALDKALELMEVGHSMELRGNVLHVASASQPGIDYATMLNECPTPIAAAAAPMRLHAGGTGGGRWWGWVVRT